MSRMLYLGCWNTVGHYLRSTDGTPVDHRQLTGIWPSIDGTLCPVGPQIEGEAIMHHKGGWTALAFWDRSVDQRKGSNSAFFAEGSYSADEMIALAREAFPSIWSRFTFDVRVTRVRDEPAREGAAS